MTEQLMPRPQAVWDWTMIIQNPYSGGRNSGLLRRFQQVRSDLRFGYNKFGVGCLQLVNELRRRVRRVRAVEDATRANNSLDQQWEIDLSTRTKLTTSGNSRESQVDERRGATYIIERVNQDAVT